MGVPVDAALLDQVEARGLLVRLAGPVDDPRWSFRHLMVREAAYASVPLGDRAAEPRQGPRTGSSTAPATPDEPDPAEVAHHTERAVALWKELGHAPGVLPSGARPSLVAAARAARERDELREAERWYQRALDLDLVEADDRIAVCLEHGSTLISLRRLHEAGEVLRAVVAAHRAPTRRPGRGPHRARRRRPAPGRRRRRGHGRSTTGRLAWQARR